MNPPLFSIVVPTLNQAQFIEQTLASIVGQNWPRLELIVIDGGSTDETHSIIERYRSHVTHFISERDQGQADAINKGMRLAKGDILAWLNSDDYYLPLSFSKVATALRNSSELRLVYGSCLMLFEDEGMGRIAPADSFDRERLTRCDFIYQPSAFWTRSLWEKTGELTTKYHFVLDWEWWLRASEIGECQAIGETLSVYRFHDSHKSGSGSPRRTQEILEIVDKYAAPEWAEVYHAVADRLDGLTASWRRNAGRPGRWTIHRLMHLDLYARYGEKVDRVFSQLRSAR